MPTSAIIIIGCVLALYAFAFFYYLNKKKLTTEKSNLKTLIKLFVINIICILIISLAFSIGSDDLSFWSIFSHSLQNPMFICFCIIVISIPIYNRLYIRYRQKKGKWQDNEEE
jgi:magnesium-transporting ATPase (P-type)